MTIQTLDAQLLLFINHAAENAVFDVLMPALSLKGYLLVLPFLFGMIVRSSTSKNEAGRTYLAAALATIAIACASTYASGLVEDWMKNYVARVRPCRALDGVRLILPCPRSYSLPSGHAISSFAFAAPLYYLTREYIAAGWRMYPIVLASLIAFSRLYLGVHYPTDVLIGGLLGAGIGLGLSYTYRKFAAKTL